MDLPRSNDSNARFSAYVEGLTSVIGHADRAKPLRDYCLGLMMPCERKSVEPMAAITAPERTAAQHQSLLHFIGEGRWSDEKVLAKVRELVLPEMERHGPIEAWIIDDTSFPKKGQHSVGVARQYCGELGKQDNCQVAVTLSMANHDASLPVAYRLYLPKDWASDRKRRRKVGVPEEITFKTKPEIALAQNRWACEAGLPRGAVVMDAGFGVDTNLRTSITALGLSYVAGIQSHTTVWAPGTGPRPPKKWSGHGRPPKLLRRDDKHKPASVKELALALPKRAWRKITWREGTAEKLSSRFARVRVRVAHRDYWLADKRPEEWLLIEWPDGEKEPIKYWLSTLRKTSCSVASSTLPSCGGGSNATIKNSSRRSGSGILKGADGAASTITLLFASRLTDSCSPSGRRFPPQRIVPPRHSRNLPYTKVANPEDPPLRPERHVPNSIATMRRRLVAALATTLSRCPCCAAPTATRNRH
jgi:SRSO17 transposase